MIEIKDVESRAGTLAISDEHLLPADPMPKEVTPEWLEARLNYLGTQLKFDLVAVVDEIVRRRLESKPIQPPIRDDNWMSVHEAAEYLGLSIKAVRYGALRRALPGHKYPSNSRRGRWRFKKEELDGTLNRKPRHFQTKGVTAW